MKKAVYSIIVLESLWATVQAYASDHGKPVSAIFEKAGKELLVDPIPLPIRPNRRVTKYHSRRQFQEEFPMIATSITLDPFFYQQLVEVYNQVSLEQYDTELSVDMTTLIHTVLYYFCQQTGLPVDQKFFSDTYFITKYSYGDEEQLLSAIRNLAVILKKEPTSREWNQHRRLVDGPSLQVIISRFGTYKEALIRAFKNINQK